MADALNLAESDSPDGVILDEGKELMRLFRAGEDWPWIDYRVEFTTPVEEQLTPKSHLVAFRKATKEHRAEYRANPSSQWRNCTWKIKWRHDGKVIDGKLYIFNYFVEDRTLRLRYVGPPSFPSRILRYLGRAFQAFRRPRA